MGSPSETKRRGWGGPGGSKTKKRGAKREGKKKVTNRGAGTARRENNSVIHGLDGGEKPTLRCEVRGGGKRARVQERRRGAAPEVGHIFGWHLQTKEKAPAAEFAGKGGPRREEGQASCSSLSTQDDISK